MIGSNCKSMFAKVRYQLEKLLNRETLGRISRALDVGWENKFFDQMITYSRLELQIHSQNR